MPHRGRVRVRSRSGQRAARFLWPFRLRGCALRQQNGRCCPGLRQAGIQGSGPAAAGRERNESEWMRWQRSRQARVDKLAINIQCDGACQVQSPVYLKCAPRPSRNVDARGEGKQVGLGIGLTVTDKNARVGRAVDQEVCFTRQCDFCTAGFGEKDTRERTVKHAVDGGPSDRPRWGFYGATDKGGLFTIFYRAPFSFFYVTCESRGQRREAELSVRLGSELHLPVAL